MMCEVSSFIAVLCTLLCSGHAQDAVLTVEPSSTIFFIGEMVSFKCVVKEGKHTDWEYKVMKDGREILNSNTNKGLSLKLASTVQSGKYRCSAHRTTSQKTKTSNIVSVTVTADKPRATLTPGSTIIPVGGSVTLACSVGSSAGWKYEWFRHDPNTEVQIRTDDQQNGVIRVSQGGIYHCRGRRGNPVYYTDKSDDVTIEITFSNKVVVKGRPSWPQIFSGETISLTCEVQEGGETTEWEYRWRGANQTTQWTHNNYWIFNVSESSSGDYTCKSRRRDDSYSSTEWSEAFNLSASTVLSSESSSFLMTVGLISGITFIVLLLYYCMKSKVFNKGSADDQRVSQDEDQQQVYSSLLHGDRCVYETIPGSKSADTGQIEDDSSVNQLKVINKTQHRVDPEESSDYCNVNPNSTPGP
uniref:Ig-like domain-containing protein n=1 Tax=Astatotilapia calliptera TaxID=8154 RepID=A0AAX7UQM3_ASTCA